MSRRSRRICFRLALFTVVLLMTHELRGAVLGVFADEAGTNCNISAPVGVLTRCYLVLRDPAVKTAVAIELGIRGLPSGWAGWIEICPYCSVVLPTGFGNGASLGRHDCVTGDPLVLAPVYIFPMTEARDVVLDVGAKIPPSNPAFDCPQVFVCDAPVFTRVCVQGGRSTVNGTRPCSVAVAAMSWSGIKTLYE